MSDVQQKTWDEFVKGDLEDGDLTGLHYMVRKELIERINHVLADKGVDLRVFSFDYFAGEYKALRAYRAPGDLAIEELVAEEVQGLRKNEIDEVYGEMAMLHAFIERWILGVYKQVIKSAAIKLSRIWNAMAANPTWDADTLDAIAEVIECTVSPDEPVIVIRGFGSGSEDEDPDEDAGEE